MEKKKEHPKVAEALAKMKKNKQDRTKGVYSGDKPTVSVEQIVQEYKSKKQDERYQNYRNEMDQQAPKDEYSMDPEIQSQASNMGKYDSAMAKSILEDMKKKKGK